MTKWKGYTVQLRAGLAFVGLLALIFVALALYARIGPSRWDVDLLYGLLPWKTGQIAPALVAISIIASAAVWDTAVVIGALVLWLARKRCKSLVFMAGLGADVVAEATKTVIDQHRAHSPLARLVIEGGFPSGHVTRTTVTLGLLFTLFAWHSRWRWPALAATVAFLAFLGTARVATSAHWPIDVLGGYTLGMFWVALLLTVCAAITLHCTK